MTGSDRAPRLHDALRDWPRRRIRLEELWRVLDAVDPATRNSLDRRSLLHAALTELAQHGLVELPGRQSYDRTEHPALPRFVTIPRQAHPPPAPSTVMWHPTLAWAADTAVAQSHRAALVRINDWLFARPSREVVPLRERSLEILGDEKALDRLVLTDLFGARRLSLGLLRTRRVAPPFHTVRVSPGPILLVVENSDTFDSLQHALAQRPGRVGMVGWGAGAAFIASVLSLDAAAAGVTDIAYFGDLDANGLRVPAAASRVAEANGLPPVRPAVGLYEALRLAGRAQPGRRPVDDTTVNSLADWLDPQHHAWAVTLLREGVRLAQEAVGAAYLAQHDGWQLDLT